MKVISDSGQFKAKGRRSVVAVGVFDGLHRGHQAIIKRVVREAKRSDANSVVLTFDPHPLSVLHPIAFSSYVMTLEQRLLLIASLGVDVCVVLRFDRSFASLSAERFVKEYLSERFNACKVVVGKDFNFGRYAQGTISTLRNLGSQYGFSVDVVEYINNKNINIKTTLIKNLIKTGGLRTLKAFLGRNYEMSGVVVRGEGRGRTLGFPTANLKKENVIILPPGIYLIYAHFGRQVHNGLFFIGHRSSSVSRIEAVSLEAHILDFKGDLYGRKIKVEFLKKLREPRKFSDDISLSEQISKDVLSARKFFRAYSK